MRKHKSIAVYEVWQRNGWSLADAKDLHDLGIDIFHEAH
jgi:hypothetical protein